MGPWREQPAQPFSTTRPDGDSNGRNCDRGALPDSLSEWERPNVDRHAGDCEGPDRDAKGHVQREDNDDIGSQK